MAKNKNHDPATEAAISVVKAEQMEEQLAMTEQEKKEKLIAKTYRMMGRIETSDLFGKLATVATFVWLKQVKESKIYKDIPGVETWETLCNRMGKSRRTVDEQIQNLNILGEEFVATCRHFSIGYKDLRKLRKSVSDGDVVVDDEVVEINGEKIPLTPDSSEDLQAAIESLLDEKDRQLENKGATLKAKDRVLEAKEKIINKQEKELHKLTSQVKARGFEPGEENFIRDMENLKTMLVGVELKMDVRNMPADMTPLMRAAYIETLGHFKRVMIAYYDEATTHYGIADDDDWAPPSKRDDKNED